MAGFSSKKELVNQVADGSFSLSRYVPDEWSYSDGTDSVLNQISGFQV